MWPYMIEFTTCDGHVVVVETLTITSFGPSGGAMDGENCKLHVGSVVHRLADQPDEVYKDIEEARKEIAENEREKQARFLMSLDEITRALKESDASVRQVNTTLRVELHKIYTAIGPQ